MKLLPLHHWASRVDCERSLSVCLSVSTISTGVRDRQGHVLPYTSRFSCIVCTLQEVAAEPQVSSTSAPGRSLHLPRAASTSGGRARNAVSSRRRGGARPPPLLVRRRRTATTGAPGATRSGTGVRVRGRHAPRVRRSLARKGQRRRRHAWDKKELVPRSAV
ncbi:hypothetical protein GQ55_5G518000 [Panicum hallii var. hallii]|jgi:hypothetical protein|uniref:Uncharacterized protein n=2 Tax=Panicum hallii TaxID=206008 RepID=A0A2T7DSI5_9POAL|nr:hypothetical protein GQ55_5G518000 [Panicum hallii var. hallii]PVH39481.1 hypothetical protein PAHAL_5G512700 [Panicum hallii]